MRLWKIERTQILWCRYEKKGKESFSDFEREKNYKRNKSIIKSQIQQISIAVDASGISFGGSLIQHTDCSNILLRLALLRSCHWFVRISVSFSLFPFSVSVSVSVSFLETWSWITLLWSWITRIFDKSYLLRITSFKHHSKSMIRNGKHEIRTFAAPAK